MKHFIRLLLPLLFFVFHSANSVPAQVVNIGLERDRHRTMLTAIRDDIKKNYYDPTLKGIDIDAKFRNAEEKIKLATAIGQMSGIIAQFMLDFEDSHLFFIPPDKVNKSDYGFDMRMVGDKCFVLSIDEKSDAAQKGLNIGDQLLGIENFGPTRPSLWKMRYYFNTLRPRPKLLLSVLKPDGKKVDIDINAKLIKGKQVLDATGDDIDQIIRDDEDAYYKAVRQYYYDKIPGLFIWKMPSFSLEPNKVDGIIDKAKNSALILDLRGNSGGRVDMLLRMIGNFFPADLKIGDEKTRKETKEVVAKSRKRGFFEGKLVILIDSESASASEVFAKVMQLEKRGTVIGDASEGAVMKSRYFGHTTGIDVVAFYGASITIADLIMKDGKSIEKIGITPDERVIPTGKDIAERRDIVLARAVEFLGFKMPAEEAGKIFPNDYNYR